MNEQEWRDQLAAALAYKPGSSAYDYADRVLPTVRAIAAAAAIRTLRDLADDLETASHAAASTGERQGLLTAARFARAKADAMSR